MTTGVPAVIVEGAFAGILVVAICIGHLDFFRQGRFRIQHRHRRSELGDGRDRHNRERIFLEHDITVAQALLHGEETETYACLYN